MSRTSEKVKDDSWILKAICHECGEIGHIRPQCPLLLEGDDSKADSPSKSKSKEKKPAEKKSKKTTFAQTETTETDNEDESGNQFASYGFANLHLNSSSLTMLDLRNMILLDNQSTVDLFCNSKLVSRVWETDNTMTVHGNDGNLTTNIYILIPLLHFYHGSIGWIRMHLMRCCNLRDSVRQMLEIGDICQ